MSQQSFLSRIKKAFSGPQEKKSSALGMIGTTQGVFSDVSAVRLAQDGYQANAVAYYCINLVASSCAQVPLRIYRKSIKKGKNVFTHDQGHELNKFISRPNPDMSGQRLQHSLHAFQLISGNIYLLNRFRNAANTPNGTPYEFEALRPDRVQIMNETGVNIGYRYLSPTGGIIDYPINPATRKCAVLQLKDFHPLDDFYGMPALEAASKQIDISNQASRFNKGLLDNGARLSIALQVSEGLDDETITNIQNSFIDKYSGAHNAGRPMILEGIKDIKELGLSPKDMEFSEAQNNSFRLIANVLGVPTYMMGLKDTQSTFNNMSEAKLFFYQSTVVSRLNYFYGDMDGDSEGEINLYFQRYFGDDVCIKPVWDRVDALAPLREKRAERAISLNGIAKIDEQREMAGLEPLNIPGVSDMPWRGSGELPIAFIDQQLQQPQEAQPQKFTSGAAEFKLINRFSEQDKLRELATFDRLLKLHEARFEPKMTALLNAQIKQAASLYEAGSDIEVAFEQTKNQFEDLLSNHYRAVMVFFGNRVLDALGKHGVMNCERKDAESFFDLLVRSFISLYVAQEVTYVNDTTREAINAAILAAEIDGLNRREAAKKIREQTGFSARRAKTIAQTETHAAANYAQREAAIAGTGVDAAEWVSAEDKRVRKTHAEANGQVVRDGEKFKVGNYKCDYPGDPTLPGKERINCRCTTAFVFDEQE